MKTKLLKAKLALYLSLLSLNTDTLTSNEVDIMFLLSKDEEIQALINGSN